MLIVGTYIIVKIIQHLRISIKPNAVINVDKLVLLDQTVNLLIVPVIVVQLLGYTTPHSQIFDSIVFCSTVQGFMNTALFHRAIGGLGMAGIRKVLKYKGNVCTALLIKKFSLNRILCLKYHSILLRIGPKTLVNSVGGIAICFSVSCGVGVSVETTILAPEVLYHLYKEPQLVDIKDFSPLTFMKFTYIVAVVFNLVEFIFYVIIFWEMNKQRRRHVQLCLSNKPKLANKKKRQNTITAAGNFASWVAEALINSIIVFAMFIDNATFFIREMIPIIYYVNFPIVLAVTSPDLRQSVFSLQGCKESCLSVDCKCTSCEIDAEAEPEEIELQVLPNGIVHNHM